MFFRAVVQAVLLLGLELLAMPEAIPRKVEGINLGFVRYIMGKREQIITDGTWATPEDGEVLMTDGMQKSVTYID